MLMPQRTNAFQTLILLLHTQLGDKAIVEESAMVMDRVTGAMREVDILITTDSASYKMIIGIECLATTRRADVRWVEQMSCKHADILTDKLILISKVGFTKDA